jgi:hypothetical protein
MNPTIDNIMALAHRWSLATYNKALGKEFEDFDEIQKALRAAIEQALTPGKPVAVPEGWHIAKADNGQVLVSAPNCDPGYAWIKNQGPLPQRLLYALVGAMLDAPQPQPEKSEAEALAALGWQAIECSVCGSSARAFPQTQREFLEALHEADRVMGHDDEHTEWREKWAHLFYGEQAPQPQPDDTAVKMIAAGNRMAAMLDTSMTAPVEQWPDEAEIDAALKEWRFAVDPCPPAAAGKGRIDDTALLRQALEALEFAWRAMPGKWEIGNAAIAAIRERLK